MPCSRTGNAPAPSKSHSTATMVPPPGGVVGERFELDDVADAHLGARAAVHASR